MELARYSHFIDRDFRESINLGLISVGRVQHYVQTMAATATNEVGDVI